MSHSKRNTSLAFFTSHERSQLKGQWGSSSTRISRDSFLPFGSCNLCLLPTRDPVACSTSKSACHLFCRECALNNLVAQKKEIKRLERERERRKEENAAAAELNKADDHVKAVADFEAVQMGLDSKFDGARIVGQQGGKVIIEELQSKGTKRKLELDQQELAKLGHDQQKKARRGEAIDLKAEARANTAVPSFWIPSATPVTNEADSKPIKLSPVCPAADPEHPHDFSLKTLVSVNFLEEKATDTPGNNDTLRTCPGCTKSLSNATKAVLAKPCGHVVCKPCAAKFMKPTEPDAHNLENEVGVVTCYVCQADLTDRKKGSKDSKEKDKIRPGTMEISCEGTGFAGGGKNMVKKKGVAFQC